MSGMLNDPRAIWDFVQTIIFDVRKSTNHKIADFRNVIDILTSEYALTNERYSALFEVMARFKTSDIGAQIQAEFDLHSEALKFLERKVLTIEEFEGEFSFLFELRQIDQENGSALELEFDPDLIRAMLGTKGSSVDSLQKEKANIMSDWLGTIRKILDDAELRVFPAETDLESVAEKAGENSASKQLENFLQERRAKKEEDKDNA